MSRMVKPPIGPMIPKPAPPKDRTVPPRGSPRFPIYKTGPKGGSPRIRAKPAGPKGHKK